MSSFLGGLWVGFAVAAPMGPIGLLVVRRSLALGALHGFASGLGAAAADATFALAAGLGLGALAERWSGVSGALRIAGGAIIVALGLRSLFARRVRRGATSNEDRASLAFATTFALTLTSPVTILTFAAVAASFGIGAGGTGSASALAAGVFVGSAAWWAILSTGVAAVRHRLSDGVLDTCARIAGAALVLLGVFSAAGCGGPPAR